MTLCEATTPEPCGTTAAPQAWKTTACTRFHRLCESHTQQLYHGDGTTPSGVDLYALVPHGSLDGRYCPDPPA